MQNRSISWLTLSFLFTLGWFLLYSNRAVLSPLLTILEDEWLLTKTQLGLLNSAFFLMYALLQLPSGSIADRIGRRLVLIPGYLFHALSTFGSGLALNYSMFLSMRSLTGLSQGTYFSAQQATTNAFTPPKRRSTAAAIAQTGCSLGVAFGIAISGLLVFRLGLNWRTPFIFLGGLTLFLTFVFYGFMPETKLSASQHDASMPQRESLNKYLPDRNMWLLLVTGFCTMYGFFVIITWLPYYLEHARGFSPEVAGYISTIMPLMTVPSVLLFGFLADKTAKQRHLISYLIPIGALALLFVVGGRSNASLYLGLLLYGIGGKLVIDPMLVTIVAENVNPQFYGKAYGLLNSAHAGGMVAAPALTGFIVDIGGTFNTAFYLAFILQMLALIAFQSMRLQSHPSITESSLKKL